MEQLALEHPDYVWAVQRLVEWHDHRADHAAVLVWSGRLTRLNPRQQSGWGYRAGALLGLDRTDEAETALRTAVALDPAYDWAVKQLLGLELQRGDTAAAERTVARVRGRIPIHTIAGLYTTHGFGAEAEAFARSAVAMNSSDGRSHEALGDALWRLERQPEALDSWITALQCRPRQQWLARQLWQKAAEAGLQKEVRDKLHAWAVAEPADEDRLEAYAVFLEKEPESYLMALDEAMQLLPEHRGFVDSKAAKLAGLRRYREAIALCGRFDGPGPPDVLLMRRRAWIEAERGAMATAVDLMKTALEQEPGSLFGLQSLCDWLEKLDRAAEAVPYAEELVRVSPQASASYGYLASALLHCSRPLEAEPHLYRALRMAHDYEWAADQLFEIQLERKDWEGVRQTLRLVREHQPGAATLLKEVRLEAGLEHKEAAFKAWEALTIHPDVREWQLSRAESCLLREAGWPVKLDQAWQDRMKQQEISPVLARFWVRREYGQANYRIWEKIPGLSGGATVQAAAWSEYLHQAGDLDGVNASGRAARIREARRAIRRHRNFLRQHTEVWAYGAYFYLGADLYREGRKWARDWQQHPGLESWMTSNIAGLMSGNFTKRGDGEIRRWSLEHLPHDHASTRHRIHLAFVAATEKELREAEAFLADVREADIPGGGKGSDLRLMLHLTRLLLRLLDPAVPLGDRRRRAAQDLREAKDATGVRLTPGSHGATLRTFLPVAMRHAGISRFQGQLLGLLPTACYLE